MELTHPLLTPGILFLLTLIFGFWLSQSRKPYNGILFNIHKLIALAGVVVTGMQFSKTLHVPDWQLAALLIVSALCVMVLFVSGALMSAGKLAYSLMLTFHRVAPVLLVLCFVLTLNLLGKTP